MKISDTCIYDHIEMYKDEIENVIYKKGTYIVQSEDDFDEIFFILSGSVMVECLTMNGKRLLVDTLSENEFVGKISYMYDQDFRGDIIAITDVSLLKINKQTLEKLKKNDKFLSLFLFKTSKRIYLIYKKSLIKNLFKIEERLAHYILENSENGIFKCKSMYELSKQLYMSRKSIYNTINKFLEKGYIKKEEDKFIILDEEKLCEISKEVRNFLK